VVVLLAAVGLQLQACKICAAGEWYEIVAQRPGPEVTDAAMRRKIEVSGQPWKVRDRATGIEMVLVMPGEFLMGSPESEPGRNADEGPQHPVRLNKAFYLGATEVTQAQWRRMMGSSQGFFRGDSLPADGSWDDLQAFLSKANANLPAGVKPLRAPTEAEWEYACRAGTTGPFSFEGPIRYALVNFNDGVVKRGVAVARGKMEVEWVTPPSSGFRKSTVPAGSLPPNAWGLYEMHGNLGEWTDDKYLPDGYTGRGPVAVNPFVRASGDEERTVRGGDWYKGARYSRAAARDGGGPHTGSNRIGFRVARTL
jgi:formylglycine-generating enzyme required for sulfatase activity